MSPRTDDQSYHPKATRQIQYSSRLTTHAGPPPILPSVQLKHELAPHELTHRLGTHPKSNLTTKLKHPTSSCRSHLSYNPVHLRYTILKLDVRCMRTPIQYLVCKKQTSNQFYLPLHFHPPFPSPLRVASLCPQTHRLALATAPSTIPAAAEM